MNARQRKKATTGKSPRLIERLMGLPRGSCLDCVSFDRPGKLRSYHGARFTPMTAPVVARPSPTPAVGDDRFPLVGGFQHSNVWLCCDGVEKSWMVTLWHRADGSLHVALDGVEVFDDNREMVLDVLLEESPPVVRITEYECSKPWTGLDGREHRVERWKDEHGEWQVRLDGKWVFPPLWDWYKKYGEQAP